MADSRDTIEFVEKYTDQWDTQTDYGEDVSSLSEWEQNAYFVERLNTEVHSAGFAGYLTSSYYPGQERLIDALQAVGAKNVLRIFQKVIKKFPFHRIPQNTGIREKLLFTIGDFFLVNLDALDEAFYDYPDNLTTMVKAYIDQHSADSP